jgi:hypothetical protein
MNRTLIFSFFRLCFVDEPKAKPIRQLKSPSQKHQSNQRVNNFCFLSRARICIFFESPEEQNIIVSKQSLEIFCLCSLGAHGITNLLIFLCRKLLHKTFHCHRRSHVRVANHSNAFVGATLDDKLFPANNTLVQCNRQEEPLFDLTETWIPPLKNLKRTIRSLFQLLKVLLVLSDFADLRGKERKTNKRKRKKPSGRPKTSWFQKHS